VSFLEQSASVLQLLQEIPLTIKSTAALLQAQRLLGG